MDNWKSGGSAMIVKANPAVLINRYLSFKLSENQGLPYFTEDSPFPFFPTLPTDIDALTETFPYSDGPIFAVYDRMFKFNRMPFPHIKCEQILYYFYQMSGGIPALLETVQAVYELLDNGDETAQELNSWIQSQVDASSIEQGNPFIDIHGEKFKPLFFHNMSVWQLEESRDIISFGTARTYAANKLIIDYKYHGLDIKYPPSSHPGS
jgi:hypothetical protein